MITAQLATIPGREESVKLTKQSLIKQVDNLYIRYNSPTDAMKFYSVETLSGYVLTCDDDLIYPPDYVQKMIEAVDRYNGEAIVSLHGRELRPGKISSYYSPSNRIQAFHCLKELTEDHVIQNGAIGTGVMAWNADKIKIHYDWFKSPNMADIWLSVNARRLGIPLVVVKHPAEWLKVGYDGEETIWHKHFNKDQKQTEVWNEHQLL
jgi:hypothetical protein